MRRVGRRGALAGDGLSRRRASVAEAARGREGEGRQGPAALSASGVWRPCGSFSEVARACLECPHIERTKVAADSASALELSAREREKTCRGDGGR